MVSFSGQELYDLLQDEFIFKIVQSAILAPSKRVIPYIEKMSDLVLIDGECYIKPNPTIGQVNMINIKQRPEIDETIKLILNLQYDESLILNKYQNKDIVTAYMFYKMKKLEKQVEELTTILNSNSQKNNVTTKDEIKDNKTIEQINDKPKKEPFTIKRIQEVCVDFVREHNCQIHILDYQQNYCINPPMGTVHSKQHLGSLDTIKKDFDRCGTILLLDKDNILIYVIGGDMTTYKNIKAAMDWFAGLF